jgi:hypothetical protein
MAEVTFDQNTYAGELYGEIIFPALVPPLGLIDKGLVTPMPGIKKRTVIRVGDVEVEFQDPSCNFNAQDDGLTIGERYIDPVKYEVMIEMCYEDIRQGWDAMKLKKGSLNDYVPPATLEKAFIEMVQRKIAIMNEQMYINGKAGVTAGAVTFTAPYPGLLERLRADSDVNKVLSSGIGGTSMALTGITSANPGVVTVASTANLKSGNKVVITGANGNQQVGGTSINNQSFIITVINATTFSLNKAVTGGSPATSGTVSFFNASNVIDLLSYVWSNMPEQIMDNPDTKIWIPRGVFQGYSLAQAVNAFGGGNNYIDKKQMEFLGNALTMVPNLPAGTVIVAPSTHIKLGFDDSGDETNIRTIYLGDTTGDDVYRYKASMKTDINHVQGQDILLISPDITAGS